MQRSKITLVTLACAASVIVALPSGYAAGSAIHQNWGNQLDAAVKYHKTKDDISRILGAPPIKCEDVPGKPQFGMLFSSGSGTTVLAIAPNGPAANAGIEAGDRIMSVDSMPVHSFEEVIALLLNIDTPKHPVAIKTQSGSYSLTPTFPKKSEQCVWETAAGQVGVAGESAGPSGETHRRYFRATCRFADDTAYSCQSSWQDGNVADSRGRYQSGYQRLTPWLS